MDVATKKLVSGYTTVLASLCYCYFISSRIPKGFLRLISLLPVFYLFTILPLHLPSVLITASSTLFLTSIANFKLALFAFGQGPLSSVQSSKSVGIFIASSALPLKTNPSTTNRASSSSKSTKESTILSYVALEFLLSAILVSIILCYKDKFHPKILLVPYCCLVLLSVDCLGAVSNLMARATVGLELEPPSDKPYLSTSLQDFWGKRWNLTVTNTLRLTVYRPVRSASAVVLGNQLAPFAAVSATFLVSGLMHELFCYYVTRAKPTWEMTSFFVLHGFCVALELAIKKALNGRWDLPGCVSGPLTIGFVMLTSFWLFFPPLIRSGVDAIVLEELRTFAEFVRNELLIHLGDHPARA